MKALRQTREMRRTETGNTGAIRNAREDKMKNKNERNARGEDRKQGADRSKQAEAQLTTAQEREQARARKAVPAGTKARSPMSRPSSKTRVKTVFSEHHVAPAHNLHVAVNVGVAIPRSVRC